ncbi:transposase [Lactobacillaceae bacterium Melli_B4]
MSRKYSKEFKDSIIKMVKDGAYARNLSKEYGHNYQTIRRWVRDSDAIINPDECDIKKLQNQLRALKRENDILKSAAIIFAKR